MVYPHPSPGSYFETYINGKKVLVNILTKKSTSSSSVSVNPPNPANWKNELVGFNLINDRSRPLL